MFPADYREEVLAIVRCLDAGQSIPDELFRWLTLCEVEGLTHYTNEPEGDALPCQMNLITGKYTDIILELTRKGRALALLLKAPVPTGVEPLLERVLAVLAPNQRRIMEFLWNKTTASYEALRTVSGGWREEFPTATAITKQLKKMKRTLEKANLLEVDIRISTASQRVNFSRPK